MEKTCWHPLRDSQDCNTQLQAQSGFERLGVQASPKRSFTKGGEYDCHTFGYNQLHSGGTVTASLCTCVCFLWRTTLCYNTHCVTTPIFLSIGNNVIPPQLLQMTILRSCLCPITTCQCFISACGYNDTHVLEYANPVELLWEFTVCQGAPCHSLLVVQLSESSFGFLMGNTTSSGVHPRHYTRPG
jgi:hypothetical protein